MVLIESLFLGTHLLVMSPRLGNHHHRSMRKRTSTENEKLHAVIKHCRITPLLVDDGEKFGKIIAKSFACKKGLAGTHPINVPTQGVDFTIVGEVAIGMGALPVGEGVRREA